VGPGPSWSSHRRLDAGRASRASVGPGPAWSSQGPATGAGDRAPADCDEASRPSAETALSCAPAAGVTKKRTLTTKRARQQLCPGTGASRQFAQRGPLRRSNREPDSGDNRSRPEICRGKPGVAREAAFKHQGRPTRVAASTCALPVRAGPSVISTLARFPSALAPADAEGCLAPPHELSRCELVDPLGAFARGRINVTSLVSPGLIQGSSGTVIRYQP
jgi:hypothetical protein